MEANLGHAGLERIEISASRRVKRSNKEENMWDCSVCTYRNSPEAFKCLMCDVRKGTSTRVGGGAGGSVVPPKVKVKAEKKDRERKGEGRNLQKGRPRLKNVDRSTAEHNAVTVNNVTVIITEFQPKHRSSSTTSSSKTTTSSGNTSSATNGDAQVMSSSEAGSISDASTDTTRNGDMTTESRSS
ncbi:YY1-associated factor 2 [Chionoecetes opilio]|uniref:YY1-associated factor 2 n=1 Tax=Chionoecetes opilio TaxID=41210 RepID=A0A8J5CXA4_CHIOP|nr:YY1-associated factor 2 [Chionoecetes opilio]